jgi:hypothetical protein
VFDCSFSRLAIAVTLDGRTNHPGHAEGSHTVHFGLAFRPMNGWPSSSNVTGHDLSIRPVHGQNLRILEDRDVIVHRGIGLMIEPQEGCDFVHARWPHIFVFSSPRGPFLPAPRTEYDGHEGQFHEPVTRVDGGELPWHVVPHHSAHEDHENKPEPQPKSKLHRGLPVNDPN